MADASGGIKDRRVLTLAAEVAETTDDNVPILLLGLKDILDGVSVGSKEAMRIKNDIWTYDLLQVLILVLKQDFEHVEGGWETAAKLATLLSHCCSGLDPRESQEFYGLCLPEAVENKMMLARKLQAKYIKTGKVMEKTRAELLGSYRTTLDALTYLFSGHPFLTGNVLRSPWALQLLITDDVDTALSTISMMLNVIRVNSDILETLDEKVIHSLLDELIYKLSSSLAMEIGSSCTRCLLTFCDAQPPLVALICARYKGLRPLLSKWTGKGFGKDLKRLMMLLEAGSAQKAEMERLHRAAITIQAMWRSFRTRQQLKKANKAFGKLQKSFRRKRELTQQQKDYMNQQADLEHQLLLARKRAIRDFRTKQLELLQIMPAGDVKKHIENEQENAALKIQTYFRGYHDRKKLAERRKGMRRIRAAVTIQRQFHRWQERMEKRRQQPPAFQRPPGLIDERRVELQNQILEWREDHPPKPRTRPQQEELHNQAQEMIQRHLLMSRVTRKKHQHREALLARLEADSDLLLNAPKLNEITEKDLETFTSKSVPVATKARTNHQAELRLLRQPWWRKLGDEYQDSQYEEDYELF